MPIVDAVCRLLAGDAPARGVVSELLARPLKAERVSAIPMAPAFTPERRGPA
jgi:glycerol-3-phosphate dehydrogenase (NAD(P)+)